MIKILTFGRPLQRFTGSLANSQQTFAIFREKSFKKEEGPILPFPEWARRYFPNFHPKLSYSSVSPSEKDFCMNCGRALGLPLVGPSNQQHDPCTEIVTQNSHQLLETATQIRTLTALAIMFFFFTRSYFAAVWNRFIYWFFTKDQLAVCEGIFYLRRSG